MRPPRSLLTLPLATLAIGLASAPAAHASCVDETLAPGSDGWTTQRENAAVLCLTNEARTTRGLPALASEARLTQAAQGHADDMASRGYFNHTSLDGRSFADRIKGTGYTYATAGENIAYGQRTPFEVVEAWMNSEGHCENILRPGYTEIGLGVAPSPRGPYWVQDFGRRQGSQDPGGAAPACPASLDRSAIDTPPPAVTVPDTAVTVPAPTTSTAPTSAPTATGAVRASLKELLLAGRSVTATLACPASATSPCVVTIALTSARSRTARIAPGRKAKVRLKARRKGRATVTVKAGRRTIARRTVRLR